MMFFCMLLNWKSSL